MELLFKAGAIAVIGALFSLLLKKNSPETALLLTLAVGCAILYFAMEVITALVDFFVETAAETGLTGAVVSVLLKAAGIAVITKFVVCICDESGQKTAAAAVELTGAALALYTALPLIKSVLDMVDSFL